MGYAIRYRGTEWKSRGGGLIPQIGRREQLIEGLCPGPGLILPAIHLEPKMAGSGRLNTQIGLVMGKWLKGIVKAMEIT